MARILKAQPPSLPWGLTKLVHKVAMARLFGRAPLAMLLAHNTKLLQET
jgi:hypothetical protein